MRENNTKILVEEANGADHSLDVLISTGESHQFSKQDQVLRLGRDEGNSKEDGEADPLSDVTEDFLEEDFA